MAIRHGRRCRPSCTRPHTVTASVRDSFGSARIDHPGGVGDRPPTVTITAPEDGTLFPVGFATTSRHRHRRERGRPRRGIKWTSDRDGLIGTGRSVITSTLTPGDHHVTAEVKNAEGTAGTAMVTVFIGSAPPQVSTRAGDGGTILEGTPISIGSARDLEDGDISSHLTWTRTAGHARHGAMVPVTLTTIGTHRIARASPTATASRASRKSAHGNKAARSSPSPCPRTGRRSPARSPSQPPRPTTATAISPRPSAGRRTSAARSASAAASTPRASPQASTSSPRR